MGEPFSTELLRMYYARLFPYEAMTRWLSYGSKSTLHHREFSFTIADDVYIRYQCFADQAALTSAIQKRQPHKIDIGAVFSSLPKDHAGGARGGATATVERELVFDIDLTDYDDIRTCCTGAKICPKCWHYMTMAVKVIDEALRTDFGFEHLLWVYSGRRGVHCWVCDESARGLSNEARSAVVDYLSVLPLGGATADAGGGAAGGAAAPAAAASASGGNKKGSLSWPLHPTLVRAYAQLEPLFAQHIISDGGQKLLSEPDEWEKLIATLPADMQSKVRDEWARDGGTSAREKWAALKGLSASGDTASTAAGGAAKKARRSGQPRLNELWKYETVFTHCYPRLDVNVSKHQNHLLKSPWCVHPKTGRVCVPFDPAHVEDFDPFAVPTISDLVKQIDAHDEAAAADGSAAAADGAAPTVRDCDKTKMAAPLAYFETHFLGGLSHAQAQAVA